MNKPATQEFTIGLHNVNGCQKYTPSAATVNGVKGRIWVKKTLIDGSWVHQGQQHVRSAAHEVEVTAAFDSE